MEPQVSYPTVEHLLVLVSRLGLGKVRDIGLLESAIHRPQSTVFGNDAYPDLFLKAAALMHSLVKNHALFDGNKRIAWSATFVFLGLNGFEIVVERGAGVAFMLACARGDLELEQITDWLREHSQPVA
ncbi:MAG: type II toxin-antitoxin system death-on-curing family toxin [Aurantimicrobium sp.]|nr:type II toxin-antitoxin system death-on-curing family toxin [Aurantimicrobium sp.]